MASILVFYDDIEDSIKALEKARLLMDASDELILLSVIPPGTSFLDKKAQKKNTGRDEKGY